MLVEMVPFTMRRPLNIRLAGAVICGRDGPFMSFLEGKPCVLRFIIALVIGFVTSLNSVTAASAQTYPQRAVKFILPFGPAAGVDITARLLGDKLAARWGKPVVIENRPGGDGLVAINAFTSANDDHTLLFVPASTYTAPPLCARKTALQCGARSASDHERHDHSDCAFDSGIPQREARSASSLSWPAPSLIRSTWRPPPAIPT